MITEGVDKLYSLVASWESARVDIKSESVTLNAVTVPHEYK
jgi:hypothetical protein